MRMTNRMTTRNSGAMVAGAAPAVGCEMIGGIEPAGCLLSAPSLSERDNARFFRLAQAARDSVNAIILRKNR